MSTLKLIATGRSARGRDAGQEADWFCGVVNNTPSRSAAQKEECTISRAERHEDTGCAMCARQCERRRE